METARHIPVLKDAVVEKFRTLQGWVLDATFGGGGHSKALLATNSHIHILAIDCDPEAEKRAEVFKKSYGDRFDFQSLNFSEIRSLYTKLLFCYAFSIHCLLNSLLGIKLIY